MRVGLGGRGGVGRSRSSVGITFLPFHLRSLPRSPSVYLSINTWVIAPFNNQRRERERDRQGREGNAEIVFFPSSSSVLGVRDVPPSFTHERAWLHRTLLEGYLISLDISRVPTCD